MVLSLSNTCLLMSILRLASNTKLLKFRCLDFKGIGFTHSTLVCHRMLENQPSMAWGAFLVLFLGQTLIFTLWTNFHYFINQLMKWTYWHLFSTPNCNISTFHCVHNLVGTSCQTHNQLCISIIFSNFDIIAVKFHLTMVLPYTL